MSRHYCYIYYDRGIPCYVGKGTNGRLMQHLGRDDFPASEHLTVVLRPHATSSEALKDEAYLISIFGIRSKGGLLLNKVAPSRGLPGSIEFMRMKIMGKVDETEFLSDKFLQTFISLNNLKDYTNMTAIANALAVPVCSIKRIVETHPDLPRSDHNRPLYNTKEVLRLVRPTRQLSRENRAALCLQNIHAQG